MIDLCSVNVWVIVSVTILKELVEYWLGKTDKIKEGSTLELLVRMLSAVLKLFKRK